MTDEDDHDIENCDCHGDVCAVCGEDTADRPGIALQAFTFWDGTEGDGLAFFPDGIEWIEDWTKLPASVWLHLTCVGNYFDGLLASLPQRRREFKTQGGGE